MSKQQPDRIKILSDFLARLQKDFSARDLSKLSVAQAGIMLGMQHKLPELVKMIQQIQAAKVNEAKIVNEVEKLEKQVESEKKLDAVAQEIFIAACASTIPMEEVLKFQKESGLDDKYLNDFNKDELNPLAAALAGGRDKEDLQKLIDAGADVNFKSPQGNTSAHFAVMFDVSEEALNVLIANDVDVNAKNNLGMTPLDMAMIKQAESGIVSPLTDILVSNGAEVSVLEGLVKGEETQGASLKAVVPDLAKKSQVRESSRTQSISGVTKGGSLADQAASATTSTIGSSSTFASQGNLAAGYLKSLGLQVGDDEDQKTILQRALLEAVNRNQSIMALYLIDSGAVVDKDVAHAAIDTKNMNLICMAISHATRDVMIGVETYAEQTYTPAACIIDAAIDHSMMTANTAEVAQEAFMLNAGIMGVAHNKLSEQEVVVEKKQEQEVVEKEAAEKAYQAEIAAAIHKDVVATEAAASAPIEEMAAPNAPDNFMGRVKEKESLMDIIFGRRDEEEPEVSEEESEEHFDEQLEAERLALQIEEARIAEWQLKEERIKAAESRAVQPKKEEVQKEEAELDQSTTKPSFYDDVDDVVVQLKDNVAFDDEHDEGISMEDDSSFVDRVVHLKDDMVLDENEDDVTNPKPMEDSQVEKVAGQAKPSRGGGISV